MPTTLSSVSICNLALNRIGVLQQIASLADQTPAGIACNAVYDFCRLDLLHEFPWGWASKYATLALLATAPNGEWTYAYQYPTDCLRIRRLITPTSTATLGVGQSPMPSWDREDTNAAPWPFEIGYYSGAQCVFTDLQGACCKYTFDQTDTVPFTPEFANVLAWRLAVELADSLANSEQRRNSAVTQYEKAKAEGAAHGLNEQQNSKPFMVGNTATIRGRF